MIDVYALLRPCLFSVGAEQAHNFTLENLDRAERLGILRHVIPTIPPNPQRFCGLTFPNPIGLAAGLDKDGRHIDALARLGFGFLENTAASHFPVRVQNNSAMLGRCML